MPNRPKSSLKQILNQTFLIYTCAIAFLAFLGLLIFWNYLEEIQKERMGDAELDVYRFVQNEMNNARDSLNVIESISRLVYKTGYKKLENETYAKLMSSSIHYNSTIFNSYFVFTKDFSPKISNHQGFAFLAKKDLKRFGPKDLSSVYDYSKYENLIYTDTAYFTDRNDIWFHEPLKKPEVLVTTDLYFDKNYTQEYIFSIVKALKNEKGEVFSVVGVDLLAKFMSERINDFTFGSSGGSFLVQSSSGKVISTVMRHQFFKVEENFKTDLFETQAGEEWQDILTEKIKYKTIYSDNDEAYIVTGYKLDILPWTIITYQKRSEFYAPIVKIFVMTIVLVMILFVLVLLRTRKLQTFIIESVGSLIHDLSEDTKTISIYKRANAKHRFSGIEEIDNVTEQINTLVNVVNENFTNYQDELRKNEIIQKELENLIRKRSNQLVASEKMAAIGVMSAGLAHEIKNPLNLIMMSAQIIDLQMKRLEGSPDDIKKAILKIKDSSEVILRSGHRADNIIKTLLMQSRTETGHQEIIKLDKLIFTHLDFVKASIKNKAHKEVKLEVDMIPDLPVIRGSSLDLGRVILNILDNAYYVLNKKSLKDDKFTPILTISASQLGAWVYLAIKDNGLGIKDENLKNLFTPFFTTKPTGEGTGLGLSMVYEIIKNHGAEIEVSSVEGEYTEFIIKFPLSESR